MRFFHAGLLGVGVLISQLAAAGTPASRLQQIGAVQAAIDFCSKVDSADKNQIERAAKTLLPDMTDVRVAAARKTTDFQKAYQAIESVLKGIAPSDGERLCAAAAHERQDPREQEHEPKPQHRR